MRYAVLIAACLLCACKEEVAQAPDPLPLTEETIAHYCMMNIAEHPGPKAQIFLSGLPDPIFFAQVRDALSYLNSAEQDGYVAAFYVNDMGAAPSWEAPGAENWIKADSAVFVHGSDRVGGMGAPEIVPFSASEMAAEFAQVHGGAVVGFDAIPEDAFLGPVAALPPAAVDEE